MSRRIPLKAAIRARVFPLHASFDWFALTAVTTVILYFAISPFFIATTVPRSWTSKLYQQISLNESLTFVLFLEAFLLMWVWLEMPRRRRAESALKRMYSIQRAISRASGRIVSMKAEQLGEGLDQELDVLREMLGVDRISCLIFSDDGKRGVRMQRCYCSGDAAEQEVLSNDFR